MATFYNNLRAFGILPTKGKLTTEGKLASPEDNMELFFDAMGDLRAKKAVTDREIERTAPIRKAIQRLSGDRIIVDSSIHNEDALKKIMTTVLKMQQFQDGALTPSYTTVKDPGSKWWKIEPYEDDLGQFWKGGYTLGEKLYSPNQPSGNKNAPYRITLKDTNYEKLINDFNAGASIEDNWWPKTGDTVESPVITHEFAHSAQAESSKKVKSPALAMDYVEKSKRQKFQDTHNSLQEIFDIAAKNTGYKSLLEAAASISRYAAKDVVNESLGKNNEAKNWSPGRRLPEVFAEAYTDVLYNGENASPYAKELMRLSAEYVKDYEDTFGKRDNKNIDSFKKALNILPPLRDEDKFIEKMRRLRLLPQE